MTLRKYKTWVNINCDTVTSGESCTEVFPSDGAREEKKAFSKVHYTFEIKQMCFQSVM